MQQYPETIVIGGAIWKVKFSNVIEGKKSLLGLCDPAIKTLHIRKNQGEDETFSTFMHEVLHGFENEYDLKIPHRTIYKLEKPLAEFFQMNCLDLLTILEG